MTDSLVTPKQPDNFTNESPIRAFTDFQIDGLYAIGKGFRPSISHLARYLNALDKKEGWSLVQVIMPDNDAADPTLIFRRVTPPLLELTSDMTLPNVAAKIATGLDQIANDMIHHAESAEGMARHDEEAVLKFADRVAGYKRELDEFAPFNPLIDGYTRRAFRAVKELGEPYTGGVKLEPNTDIYQQFADAIRPKHYGGDACAKIIEQMPGNVALAFKYIWRLFEKDAARQEIGKALFYLDREQARLQDNNRARIGYRNKAVAQEYREASKQAVLTWLKTGVKASYARQAAMFALIDYAVDGFDSHHLRQAVEQLDNLEAAL